jgi:P27 family predicted phage terminase small subunit
MRGRPAKPTKLKILAGNPGKRRLPDKEPQPRAVAPTMPAWLSAEAKQEWRRIVPELQALGLLTIVDRVALASYCQAWAELVIATQLVTKEGRLITINLFNRAGEFAGTKQVLHPAVKMQRDAFARVKAFIGEFGLTPASRTKVRGDKASDGPADPFEAFLNGPKKA